MVLQVETRSQRSALITDYFSSPLNKQANAEATNAIPELDDSILLQKLDLLKVEHIVKRKRIVRTVPFKFQEIDNSIAKTQIAPKQTKDFGCQAVFEPQKISVPKKPAKISNRTVGEV